MQRCSSRTCKPKDTTPTLEGSPSRIIQKVDGGGENGNWKGCYTEWEKRTCGRLSTPQSERTRDGLFISFFRRSEREREREYTWVCVLRNQATPGESVSFSAGRLNWQIDLIAYPARAQVCCIYVDHAGRERLFQSNLLSSTSVALQGRENNLFIARGWIEIAERLS